MDWDNMVVGILNESNERERQAAKQCDAEPDIAMDMVRLANLWFLKGTPAHETIMRGVREIGRLRDQIRDMTIEAEI